MSKKDTLIWQQTKLGLEDRDQASIINIDEIDHSEKLIIDIDGFEGPLHVLLELAKRQKVDLMRLSITKLADQYLGFVRMAKAKNLSLAADYLVMASWLAYLKSRLLMPKPTKSNTGEDDPEMVARALSLRLMKLQAVRQAVESLNLRPLLGRDVFLRGMPQNREIIKNSVLNLDLYDLLKAYVRQRQPKTTHYPSIRPRHYAFALDKARSLLALRLRTLNQWTSLTEVLPNNLGDFDKTLPTQSIMASHFAASLELTRDGQSQLRQEMNFGDIFIKVKDLKKMDQFPIKELIPTPAIQENI
jgi:segregation and condensation protein A